MNSRQFLNSVISVAVEKLPKARRTLYLFPKFLFPAFLKKIKLQDIERPYMLAFLVYFSVFFLVFFVQALFAFINGKFYLPVGLDQFYCVDVKCLEYFLGDYANLLNYIFFVEAYCISGVFFLIYSIKIDELFKKSHLVDYIDFPQSDSSLVRGVIPLVFVMFSALMGSAGYAVEIQNYDPHWYMNTKTGIASFSGYYYLFINFILLLFVAFVGVAHFGLFKTASTISKSLRTIHQSGNMSLMKNWTDENKVKEWLSPFSTQVLISKVFVLSIIMNMMSWKMGEPDPGKMHDISVLVMVIIGMWIVTLPRYFIQYHLFQIRKKYGVIEYKDIRMPWVLGASATVDILLFIIAGKVLLNNKDAMGIFGKFFGV